jgi:hypothetical protein
MLTRLDAICPAQDLVVPPQLVVVVDKTSLRGPKPGSYPGLKRAIASVTSGPACSGGIRQPKSPAWMAGRRS